MTTIRLGPPVPYPVEPPNMAKMSPAAFWQRAAECALAKLTTGHKLISAVACCGRHEDIALQLFLARALITLEDDFSAALKRHEQAGGIQSVALRRALAEVAS